MDDLAIETTTWLSIPGHNNWNESVELEVTKDGIVIDLINSILWEWLDRARIAVMDQALSPTKCECGHPSHTGECGAAINVVLGFSPGPLATPQTEERSCQCPERAPLTRARVELIEKIYYQCQVPSHRHIKSSAAEWCIKRMTPKPRTTNEWTPEAKISVAQRWRDGEKLKSIAAEFHVSTERIRHVAAMGERLLRVRQERHRSQER